MTNATHVASGYADSVASRRRQEAQARPSRMLPARFDLVFEASGETVTDVEALARGVMGAERWPIALEPADNAELLAHLLGEAVVLERRYRPQRGIEARPWLFQRLRFRARDWRDAQRRHFTLAELPALQDWDTGAPDYRKPERDRSAGLGDRPDERAGEDPGDRGDAGMGALRRGLLEGRDRTLEREVAALGVGALGRARDVGPRPPAAAVEPEPDRGFRTFVDCPACSFRSYRQPPNGQPGWHFRQTCVGCGGPIEVGWEDEAA